MAELYQDVDYLEPGVVVAQLNFLQDLDGEDVKQIFTQAVKDIQLHGRELLHAQDEPVEYVWVLLDGKIGEVRRGGRTGPAAPVPDA
ncbi:MAG: hypothetical protein IPK16_23135 [Anaerolineales bacterium]|nr:hypothetical protein [Anaerolineales bacterium]